MHGVFITKGPQDWQIFQQEAGLARITLSGTYNAPEAAINIGIALAVPIIRVMSEDDNSQLIPWTAMPYMQGQDASCGTFEMTLNLPAGGLYRIETGLDTKSTDKTYAWIFRGDVRLHLGVGDLFVIAGQSNSAGYGRDSAFDPPSEQVHLFRNRQCWDLASHPVNESTFGADALNAEMGISGVSPYLAFGKALHRVSHSPVGLISTAMGGQPISRWDTRVNGDLFHNMIDKTKSCGKKAAGILWYQGCSDTIPERADIYLDSFRHVVEETRKALGYDIPFFTFQLNRELASKNDESYGMVREAQRIAASSIPGVYILPTMNIPLSDGIHNNAHGNIQLGEKMAKLCSHVLYQAPAQFAPDIISAVCRRKILTLTFSNVQRNFAIFTPDASVIGFTLRDEAGDLLPENFTDPRSTGNTIVFNLSRELKGSAFLSFCSEAVPSVLPPVDEVTYLPPLSFYNFPVTLE